MNQEHTICRFIPATEWSLHHPWPKNGGLRHLIFHAKTNGFERVVRRIGRRVLINEQEFLRWVEEYGSEVTR
jgi:hypothetical protein